MNRKGDLMGVEGPADFFDPLPLVGSRIQINSPEIARIKRCGCWCIKLAQGVAILPCRTCQPRFMAALEFEADYGSQFNMIGQ